MSEVEDNIRPGVGEGWRRGLRMLRRWVEGNEGD